MTTFAAALSKTTFSTRTTNGMSALQSTTDPVVDFFYVVGASRGKNIVPQFERAFQHDPELATRVALWSRDVRGGSGERQLFRDILLHLENLHPEMLHKILPHVPVFGRWDDILIFKTEEFKQLAYTMLGDALRDRNGLAAKWTPRKGAVAVELRAFYGMTPKQYRKSLVALTNVVETKMCSKQWNQIEFGKLPSLAAARYQKAFGRNAADAYAAYKAALVAGTAKINAGAVYPYDVIRTISDGDPVVARAQWDALPNYMGDANVLPMVDVSGSMMCPVGGYGSKSNLTCMDVAVSLGLYCADKARGAFKNLFLTFTSTSEIVQLKGDILSKHAQMSAAHWGGSTNLHSAFDAVLRVATTNSVPVEDMPQYIVIFSDMQFNYCVHNDDSAMQMIERKYSAAGYPVPKVVFWNLNAAGNVPVAFDKSGTALVSGFSPAVMKSILSGSDFTPRGIMLATVNVPRYTSVV